MLPNDHHATFSSRSDVPTITEPAQRWQFHAQANAANVIHLHYTIQKREDALNQRAVARGLLWISLSRSTNTIRRHVVATVRATLANRTFSYNQPHPSSLGCACEISLFRPGKASSYLSLDIINVVGEDFNIGRLDDTIRRGWGCL